MVVGLVLFAGAGTSCTADRDPETDAGSAGEQPTPEMTVQATVQAVPVEVSQGSVTGQITKQQRKIAVRDVAEVTDQWLEAAYVGGDYPRGGFGASFPGFTKGAAKTARGDGDLMTNADLGMHIDGVQVEHRRVVVDLLGVDGTARAATARVDLKFTTSGFARKVRVRGRLFLTPAPDGTPAGTAAGTADGSGDTWQVFGYDVVKARS